MRTKSKLTSPPEVEPRAEHPHRCTAGHRWQHGGPTASTCGIPSYDPISGDLPFVGPEDCPVCCGRSDLLVRELHSHYCNLCDGDWKHEGHCLESLAACCPWCFPKLDAEPMPGARSGPHFHVCSECGQNWRHATGCAEPLRAVFPECPGCRSASPSTECDAPTLAPSPPTPSADKRALGARIRPLARPIGVAAVVLLSIPIVLKGVSVLRSPGADGGAPALEARIEAPRSEPAPAAPAPPAARAPSGSAPDLAKRPAESSPAKPVPKGSVARLPVAPTPVVRKEARRAPVSDRVTEPWAQESPSRILRSQESDVLAEPAPPPAARSELVAEAPPRVPETPPIPSENGPPTTPVRAALPSIPGAPAFSGLSGSSGLDTSLDGHPRRANR